MANALMKYGDINAKVSVMRRFLLKTDDYDELLSKTKVSDVVAYLKQSDSYKSVLTNISENSIHRGQLEGLIKSTFDTDCNKLSKFSKGILKKFLSIYIVNSEIAFLKKLIGCIHKNEIFVPDISSVIYKEYSFDFTKISTAKSFTDVMECLKDTIYYSVLNPLSSSEQETSIFKIEMALDMLYYKTAWKYANKYLDEYNRKFVKNTLGTEIDILNLLWIIRSKKHYEMDKRLIYAYVLPINYRLKNSEIKELVESNGAQELNDVLSRTKYSDILNYSDFDLEHFYNDSSIKNMKKALVGSPFSIMSALSYLHDKLIEIGNIIRITEGVRYDIDRQELRKYLVWKTGGNNGN